MKKKLFLCWCLVVSFNADAICSDSEPWKVCESSDSSTNAITLGNREISSPSSINNIFGLHSLWWGTQNGYMDASGNFVAGPLSLLKEDRPSIIRNGGAVNSIDWKNCIGNMSSRPLLSLKSENLKSVCKFGPDEYESLNNQLGNVASWYVANIVGYDEKIQNFDDSMQQNLRQYVLYVRGVAPYKTIYWELGNELEFLKDEHWEAKEIISRANIAASIIHATDPNAKVIMPLLAYTPAWMSEKNITHTQHNTEIIEGTKGNVDGYSFHLYYDHNISWVKTSAQLNFLANQYSLISSLGIQDPSIWISEHAVWPEGDYTNHDEWAKNWYKTGNFDGVLSTADFIAGLTQISGVSGAMYHSLGYLELWSFLVKDSSNKLVQSKISMLYKLFYPAEPIVSVSTLTTSTIGSEVRAATVNKYSMPVNQYKFRAAGFNVINSNKKVIWIVNRGGDANILIDPNFSESVKSILITTKTMIDNGNATDIFGESTPIEETTSTANLDSGKFKVESKNRSISVLEITPSLLENTESPNSTTDTDSGSGTGTGTETTTDSGSGTGTGTGTETTTDSGNGTSSGTDNGAATDNTASSSGSASSSSGSSSSGSSSSSGGSRTSGGSSSSTNNSSNTPVIATYGFSAGGITSDGSNENTSVAGDENTDNHQEINNMTMIDNASSSFKAVLIFQNSSNVLISSPTSGKILVDEQKNSGDEVAVNSNEPILLQVSDIQSTKIYYNGELLSQSDLEKITDENGILLQ